MIVSGLRLLPVLLLSWLCSSGLGLRSSFAGSRLVTPCGSAPAVWSMRKQKASDKRTRRRQRGLLSDEDISLGVETITKAPTHAWKNKEYVETVVLPRNSGRGRSRKRSKLYQTLAFYNNKFASLLTQEYKAEEDQVLGRIKASVDEPLALEEAGFALFDLYATRRGNFFSDEVYRLEKSADATTIHPRSLEDDDFATNLPSSHQRCLLPSHKFSINDVCVITKQPNGSGDFFDPANLPTSESADKIEARVLAVGPTYVDIATSAGAFEGTFGLAPNDKSGKGNKSLRLRLDKFVSPVSYERAMAALAQITAVPENLSEKDQKSGYASITLDDTIREAILSTYAFMDDASPMLRDEAVCDLSELNNRLAKPPMMTSPKLANQIIQFLKTKTHSTFPDFNRPQLAAIEAALSRRLTLIQGPPGTGKTVTASAITFGFAHQCRSISPHAKVLASAFSNIGADNLAEAVLRSGLRTVRVGKPSAISPGLWNHTLDAFIDQDPVAQKALRVAAQATTRAKHSKDRALNEAATAAVKASIRACNIAATKALREADVVVTTSVGAADPRLLAACGLALKADADDNASAHSQLKPTRDTSARTNAPDDGPPLSFPFLLVDEACQSVEPSTLIPIVASDSCRSLVLLGDPCQLPPTIHSGYRSPLSISLMERLSLVLQRPEISSKVGGVAIDSSYLDSLPVKQAKSTMMAFDRSKSSSPSYRKRFPGSLLLSIQYRMHPSIAALPSAIFYDGQLLTPEQMRHERTFPQELRHLFPCADSSIGVRVIDVGGRCHERRGVPPRLSSAAHTSMTEEQATYWNEAEAERTLRLMRDLLACADVKSIGIISPYNGQVQLIQSLLNQDKEIKDMLRNRSVSLEVSSVDGYQGRERDVIIFSAVRSNRANRIGFLHDWRRLNVAMTRAKSGLFVVGDLDTLVSADKYWTALVRWAEGVRCVLNDFDDQEDEPSH